MTRPLSATRQSRWANSAKRRAEGRTALRYHRIKCAAAATMHFAAAKEGQSPCIRQEHSHWSSYSSLSPSSASWWRCCCRPSKRREKRRGACSVPTISSKLAWRFTTTKALSRCCRPRRCVPAPACMGRRLSCTSCRKSSSQAFTSGWPPLASGIPSATGWAHPAPIRHSSARLSTATSSRAIAAHRRSCPCFSPSSMPGSWFLPML